MSGSAQSQRFIETAIAIRMSCLQLDMPSAFVYFSDSPKAIERSLDLQVYISKAGKLQNVLPVRIRAEATPEEIQSVLRTSGVSLLKTFPVVWEGKGVFGCAGHAAAAQACVEAFAGTGGLAELQENPLRTGRMLGCIAIVTGSAQGFGSGIAQELAREGASVVIADLNEDLGRSCSHEINERFGEGTSVFGRADVTSLESLESLIETTVRNFGGVDLFISNAGVLKAGGLHELDEKSFDLVTDVNYKAFFLCTKAVAPVMKLQHLLHNNHFMDIVQINSKSGLVGSNRNFAYAGSKFGGIGLTQSFALELIDHNIKVNAICPGNYFEGPLWSDPERGLFVQYLRAGKVPGAQTIADVKKFYTDKVPMKRGCSPLDVARAIFYLHEQQYETGQAIPVTGGQVMLS